MQDRYRKRYRVPEASGRLRQQIALEAARRIYKALFPPGQEPPQDWLDALSAGDLYSAKRRAAAVLGQRIRPGDLPSDTEVREHLVALWRDSSQLPEPPDEMPDLEPAALIGPLAEHLDRSVIYKLRFEPLEQVKQNPKQQAPRG